MAQRVRSQLSHNSRQQYPLPRRAVKTGCVTCRVPSGLRRHRRDRIHIHDQHSRPPRRASSRATRRRPGGDRSLLAGLKHTGPGAAISRRHALDMASGAATSTTRPGWGPVGTAPGGRSGHGPPSGLRTDLTVPAGLRPGREELRRAPAGGTAVNAGVTWERVDAEDGGPRACPSVDRPATPQLFERRRPRAERTDRRPDPAREDRRLRLARDGRRPRAEPEHRRPRPGRGPDAG